MKYHFSWLLKGSCHGCGQKAVGYKLWALNSWRVNFLKILNVSHHEDYPVQLLISDSRLGKTQNDTFKVMQKERHTYSFNSQKRKPLNISKPGGLWPRTTANQDLALCFASEVRHPQLAWGLERKPADTLFWLGGAPRGQYEQESEWVPEASKEQSLSKRRLCTEAKAGNDSGHKGFTLLQPQQRVWSQAGASWYHNCHGNALLLGTHNSPWLRLVLG